jgi:chemotaxis protein MotB
MFPSFNNQTSFNQTVTSPPATDNFHARFVPSSSRPRLQQEVAEYRLRSAALLESYAAAKNSQKKQNLQDKETLLSPPDDSGFCIGRNHRSFPPETDHAQHTTTGQNRWLLPYADMITLLLAVFLLLFYTQLKAPASSSSSGAYALNALVMENTAFQEPPSQTQLSQTPFQNRPDIRKHLQQSGASIVQQSNGIIIRIPEKILFSAGSDTLTPRAQQALNELATVLRSLQLNGPKKRIQIEGHTDNTPVNTSQFPSNWELSTSRAIQILKYLASHHHISPSQLSAVGYAEYQPIAENSTIEGKQKNRRVDIVVVEDSFHQTLPHLKNVPENKTHSMGVLPSSATGNGQEQRLGATARSKSSRGYSQQ